MTDIKPSRRLPAGLLTRDQVLSALRQERAMLGLSKTADKYAISPQQLNDVLAGRANLSKRMAERMSYLLWTLYEKRGDR